MIDSIKSTTKALTTHRGRHDYYWSTNDEAHIERRKMMLEKYGKEIRKLYGPDPLIWKIATPLVFLQLCIGAMAANMSWPVLLLTAYIVGGTISHNSFLAVHEITHNLVFRKATHNNLFAIFINVIVPLPYAMSFKSYHKMHHNFLGWEKIDTDIPTALEATLLSSTIGKFFFIAFQVFFYVLRPVFTYPMKIEKMHVVNAVASIVSNILIWKFLGGWCLFYFFLSILFGTGLHPMAGHFISEHFIFSGNGTQETFSYYGPLNWFGWNVGYHVEHHDFPYIPWTRLHRLREIAPEFYDKLEVTSSWPLTLYNFIVDPNVNQFSRVMREKGAYKRVNPRLADGDEGNENK
uniref:sphingolipid 4-desaturase n=1 Tax=Trypanosoma congolense (strain IL3000) TaxID=1068625 RepID=G0UNP9_TRYCI|nr:putative fatty acid desaturase [Trypanosoma congolense IL3000]